MINKILNRVKANRRSNIWRYYAFTFVEGSAFLSAVLVPFFTDWGHISLLQVQTLQSWFMVWNFILEVPTGAIADFIGRKYSLALGGFATAIAVVVYSSVPDFRIFLLAEFIFAVGSALISGANEALLYDCLVEENKTDQAKKVFGRANSLRLIAMLIAAPLGGFMAGKWGINSPVRLSAIPFGLAGLLALAIREPKKYRKESESVRYLEVAKKGFSFFVNHQELRSLAANSIIVAVSAYFVIWFYQPLLEKAGVPITVFGLFHALLVLSEIAVSSGFERLEKLFGGQEAFIKGSALLTAAAFILVAIYPSKLSIILFLVFAGGFGLTRATFISSHMNQFIPSEKRATVLSSISMFRKFSLAAFNPLVGFTADKSLSLALLGLGLLPLITFIKTSKRRFLARRRL